MLKKAGNFFYYKLINFSSFSDVNSKSESIFDISSRTLSSPDNYLFNNSFFVKFNFSLSLYNFKETIYFSAAVLSRFNSGALLSKSIFNVVKKSKYCSASSGYVLTI